MSLIFEFEENEYVALLAVQNLTAGVYYWVNIKDEILIKQFQITYIFLYRNKRLVPLKANKYYEDKEIILALRKALQFYILEVEDRLIYYKPKEYQEKLIASHFISRLSYKLQILLKHPFCHKLVHSVTRFSNMNTCNRVLKS